MANTEPIRIKMVNAPSMAKAIRRKCLDCCCSYSPEVTYCAAEKCPLWPYRFGANPAAAVKQLEKYYTVKVVK